MILKRILQGILLNSSVDGQYFQELVTNVLSALKYV